MAKKLKIGDQNLNQYIITQNLKEKEERRISGEEDRPCRHCETFSKDYQKLCNEARSMHLVIMSLRKKNEKLSLQLSNLGLT